MESESSFKEPLSPLKYINIKLFVLGQNQFEKKISLEIVQKNDNVKPKMSYYSNFQLKISTPSIFN